MTFLPRPAFLTFLPASLGCFAIACGCRFALKCFFADVFVLPGADVGRSALDASRGGSDGAIQTHGATAGAAIGIAAAASSHVSLSSMKCVVAGLLAALRPSGERIAGASYPLAAILIGAATGLTIYNGRHAVSRRLDDIQVLTLHSTSRL